eukprot:5861943-Amphidinium_carterae.1
MPNFENMNRVTRSASNFRARICHGKLIMFKRREPKTLKCVILIGWDMSDTEITETFQLDCTGQ